MCPSVNEQSPDQGSVPGAVGGGSIKVIRTKGYATSSEWESSWDLPHTNHKNCRKVIPLSVTSSACPAPGSGIIQPNSGGGWLEIPANWCPNIMGIGDESLPPFSLMWPDQLQGAVDDTIPGATTANESVSCKERGFRPNG